MATLGVFVKEIGEEMGFLWCHGFFLAGFDFLD